MDGDPAQRQTEATASSASTRRRATSGQAFDPSQYALLDIHRTPAFALRHGIGLFQYQRWPAEQQLITTAFLYRDHLGVLVADHGQDHAAALMSLIHQGLLQEGRDFVSAPESAARALRALCHPQGGLQQGPEEPGEAGRVLLTPAGALRADQLGAVGWAAGAMAGGRA